MQLQLQRSAEDPVAAGRTGPQRGLGAKVVLQVSAEVVLVLELLAAHDARVDSSASFALFAMFCPFLILVTFAHIVWVDLHCFFFLLLFQIFLVGRICHDLEGPGLCKKDNIHNEDK